jgi:hypothetical protein
MRKSIMRTITATTIESANVTFKKGLPVVEKNAPITVNGVIAEDKALKEIRKTYGNTAQVTALNEVNDIYEISVEDFIKYATKIVAPSSTQIQSATE